MKCRIMNTNSLIDQEDEEKNVNINFELCDVAHLKIKQDRS